MLRTSARRADSSAAVSTHAVIAIRCPRCASAAPARRINSTAARRSAATAQPGVERNLQPAVGQCGARARHQRKRLRPRGDRRRPRIHRRKETALAQRRAGAPQQRALPPERRPAVEGTAHRASVRRQRRKCRAPLPLARHLDPAVDGRPKAAVTQRQRRAPQPFERRRAFGGAGGPRIERGAQTAVGQRGRRPRHQRQSAPARRSKLRPRIHRCAKPAVVDGGAGAPQQRTLPPERRPAIERAAHRASLRPERAHDAGDPLPFERPTVTTPRQRSHARRTPVPCSSWIAPRSRPRAAATRVG